MKLKHRITGTILMIAFASTSALPAATIPQLKNPPKAVSAPRVPAAVAPRIPVVPKVNIPAAPKVPVVKVPAVKVPAVKVPVVPKVVSTPKVPVVKVPVPPKIVSAPKVPVVKVPAAPVVTKSPVTPKPAALSNLAATKTTGSVSKNSKTPVSKAAIASAKTPVIAPAVVSVDLIRQKIREVQKENASAPETGADPKIPHKGRFPDRSKPLDRPSIGGSDNGSAETLFGVKTGKGGERKGIFDGLLPERETPELKPIENKKFDQGFGSRRDPAEAQAAAEGAGIGGKNSNPVKLLTSGGVGGFIGESANSTAPMTSPPKGGAAGSGLVSADAVDAVIAIAAFIGAAMSGQAPAILPAGAAAIKTTYDAADASAYKNADRFYNMVESWSDPTKPENKAALKLRNAKGGVGTPDPENQGTPKFGLYDLSPGILQHLGQASSGLKGSQGGSSDATPVDDSITGGTPVGAAAGTMIVDKKNGLLGNPVRAGMREGGAGTSGPNFNGTAGQINVGPDGVTHQDGSGREIDPLAGMGNGTSEPPTNLGGGRTVSTNNDEDDSTSSDSSSSTTTTTQTAAKKKK